jgi:hypothetical protein|nr:MAG TPA: DNA REPAIR HELICASE RAD25, SSL2, PRE-INITIATION COMPLEX, RNA POLYMERASE.0A [Bacteriophage sp.]
MKDKIKQLANDYAAVLKEAKSMGCNEIRALYNIPLENIELIVQALETIKKLSDRKMTTEVLENYMQFEDECVKRGFTFKSMIEARKKQIARKPDFTEDKEFALCPCCNGKGLFDKQKYCDNCGQKIDWSEESEG